jgi:hypothetical protein
MIEKETTKPSLRETQPAPQIEDAFAIRHAFVVASSATEMEQ